MRQTEAAFTRAFLAEMVDLFLFETATSSRLSIHRSAVFESLSVQDEGDRITFVLRLRERREPRRAGTATFWVENPLPEGMRTVGVAEQWAQTLHTEVQEDLESEEPIPPAKMNWIRWDE